MMFYTLGEPEYKNTNWYKAIFEGLLSEKRQKRFSLTVLESIDDLAHHKIGEEDIIFVIGTNSLWLESVLPRCEAVFDNRVIVLANHENRFSKGKYSIVTADITHSVQVLYRYLQLHGRNRIAMYGVNPRSSSDTYRKRSFLLCGGKETDLYYNTVSLSQCFADFAGKAAGYDAVICVNDYAAISLTRHLEDDPSLFITSCGAGSRLLDFFCPSITHTRINYSDFGHAGLDLCRVLQKNPNANSVHIYLAAEFVAGDTTGQLPFVSNALQQLPCISRDDDRYYSDLEIDEMIRVEQLLCSCCAADLKLIRQILAGKTYIQIAEESFMSVNGIKYKLKNMFSLCGVSTRREFAELLRKYIHREAAL